MLISIDINALKEKISGLQAFLNEKFGVEVNVSDKLMHVGSEKDQLSRGKVKDYIERFFYRNNLSKTYNVRLEKDAIKIVKIKS